MNESEAIVPVFEGEIVPPAEFTLAEREEAAAVRAEVDLMLQQIKKHEVDLDTDFAKLGSLLLKIRAKKYWAAWDFTSFSKYIQSLRKQVKKGRTQLYATIGIAEQLLPIVGEAAIEKMGISKAAELKRVVKSTGGRRPSEKLLEAAVNSEVSLEEFRVAVFEETHVKSDHPGTFRHMPGFLATAEEWAWFEAGYDIVAKTDPPISHETPEWARAKEIQFRLLANFRATFEAEVTGEQTK
jgi:hypothetical protein